MEEETEAMASQFSSLVVVDDRFSKLPEHIIHRILGFLPSIKEVVRTSAISKPCLKAWLTFPIAQFDIDDFVSYSSSISHEEEVDAQTKQFIGFVNSSLQRFERQIRDGNSDGMLIFNLRTFSKLADYTTRWIGMALDNKVNHLFIRIVTDSSELPTLIPDRVLSAYWLKSLVLVGPTIDIPLNEASHVDLHSLISLRIQDSEIIDEALHKLLIGCPVLENIALWDCDSLFEVDIFGHPNLQTLHVNVGNNAEDLTAISVRAPKLKYFGYTCRSVHDVVVKIHDSPELKSLRFSCWNRTDEWFNKFIAQFPLIEDLAIDCCNALRKIRISNPLLEKINIGNEYNLEDVVISSKKLAAFYLFTLQSSIPNPSIRIEMDSHLNDCKARIRAPCFGRDLMMEASWYFKLKEFLARSVTFKSLNITVNTYSAVYVDMKGKDVHKILPHAACNIEKLRVGVIAPSFCHYPILNGLLSACNPTTLKLDANCSDNSFIELVCKELCNRENNGNCFCKDDFKCWKHQLKDVKIEKIKGIKLEEDLDWYALFRLLYTVKTGNSIYFKLLW